VIDDEVAVAVGREPLRCRADPLPFLRRVLLAADRAPNGLLASALVQQRDLLREERRHRLLRVDHLDHVVEQMGPRVCLDERVDEVGGCRSLPGDSRDLDHHDVVVLVVSHGRDELAELLTGVVGAGLFEVDVLVPLVRCLSTGRSIDFDVLDLGFRLPRWPS